MKTRVENAQGFTLIEVLVAVAIAALGLMAVFSALSQMVGAANRLRDRTLATWIAEDRITELRVSEAYPEPSRSSDEIVMARQDWSYTLIVSETNVEGVRRVDVEVAFADDPDRIVGSVSGFLGPAPEQRALPSLSGLATGAPDDQFTEGEFR